MSPNNALSFLGFDITCIDVEPSLVSTSNKQVNKEGKVRIVSIDQQECVNQFLSKYDDIPVIRNINSPMANKYQILADDTPLEGEG